jgi:hypothetical protein
MRDMADMEQELEAVRAEFHNRVEIAYTRIRDLMETREDDAEVAPLVGRVEDIAEVARDMLRWADRAAMLEKISEIAED